MSDNFVFLNTVTALLKDAKDASDYVTTLASNPHLNLEGQLLMTKVAVTIDAQSFLIRKLVENSLLIDDKVTEVMERLENK